MLLTKKTPCAAAVFALLTTLAGCQSYQASPLDVASHRAEWLARAPDSEPVRALVDRLGVSDEPTGFDPADGLSLAEGEVVALVFNADLRLARRRAGVAAATAEHAGRWEDPVFGLDFLSLTESASNPLQISPGLSFTIPISGRLGAERDRAHAALSAELARVAELEWETRIDLRRAWLRWSAATVKAERATELAAAIESLSTSTDRLAETGELAPTEAALFRIELASQRQALIRHRHDAARAQLRIRALLGLSPGAPLDLVPVLAIESDVDTSAPEAIAERSLTLARLRREYAAAEQKLRREVREQYPDLSIGPLAEFDRGDTLLGFSLSLPIPILNANKQGIAEAHAERELARAAFETTYERLAGSLEEAQTRAESAQLERELIESDIVPLVDRQLADARSLLALGERGGLILLESLSRAGRIEMDLVDARLGEALARVDIAALTGPRPRTQDDMPKPTDEARSADEVTP